VKSEGRSCTKQDFFNRMFSIPVASRNYAFQFQWLFNSSGVLINDDDSIDEPPGSKGHEAGARSARVRPPARQETEEETQRVYACD
jgi:hypothetical protein